MYEQIELWRAQVTREQANYLASVASPANNRKLGLNCYEKLVLYCCSADRRTPTIILARASFPSLGCCLRSHTPVVGWILAAHIIAIF